MKTATFANIQTTNKENKMTLRPILQQYTDSMHMHYDKRANALADTDMANCIDTLLAVKKALNNGAFEIKTSGDAYPHYIVMIRGNTDWNEIGAYVSEPELIDALRLALHDVFCTCDPSDIRSILERNGESI